MGRSSADIDAARHEVKVLPPKGDNYRQRALMRHMRLRAIQQRGADTRPYADMD